MSKYYINQKFSFRDRFVIKDEEMNDAFVAEGEFLTLGKRIMLRTMTGEDLLFIKQRLWRVLSQYEFYVGDDLVCEMKQEFAFFKKHYTIVSPDWTITGDIWALDFDISDGSQIIARINKKFLSFMDAYEIEIFDEEYTELILGIVIAIDADIESSQSS